jgi:neutral ceramidase
VGANPFFGEISKNLYRASPELKTCQYPKEILLPVGELGWTPKVLPVQLLRIGSLHLVGLPQEPTVVSGLRIRQTVARELGPWPGNSASPSTMC